MRTNTYRAVLSITMALLSPSVYFAGAPGNGAPSESNVPSADFMAGVVTHIEGHKIDIDQKTHLLTPDVQVVDDMGNQRQIIEVIRTLPVAYDVTPDGRIDRISCVCLKKAR